MPTTNIKQEAHRLIEQLPETATWDDLMYEIYVRQAIEAGLADSEAGRRWMSRRSEPNSGWHRESTLDAHSHRTSPGHL